MFQSILLKINANSGAYEYRLSKDAVREAEVLSNKQRVFVFAALTLETDSQVYTLDKVYCAGVMSKDTQLYSDMVSFTDIKTAVDMLQIYYAG